ncbi:MAG: ectonucleotide pyrophosphatase/phosphodiesterase [Clostridiales bacterium]|nr:ectonucleotide pyrophosphatase/phosphodiesterase [Clostridiales bacterium]
MKKGIIVISFDALCSSDLDDIKKLQTFNFLIQNSLSCLNVEPVYPTLTYPNHASIITGKMPFEHGIINNTKLQPFNKSPDWYWFRKDIKTDTLYDIARKNGLSTCLLLWPTTGCGKITYNLPEIFPNRPWQNQILVSLMAGSKLFQITLNKNFGKLLDGINQPNLDDFVLESAIYTIKRKSPNLMLIHFTDLDTQKHKYGTKSSKAKEALLRHENRLKKIFDTAANLGYKIAILGDHGSLDVHSQIALNTYFKEHNLLKYVYLKSCEGSSYIYLRGDVEDKIKHKIIYTIEDFNKNFNGIIEKIIFNHEYKKLGFDKNAFLMLEPREGFCFTDSMTIEIINQSNYKAVHGQLPNKHKTIFCLWDGLNKQTLPSLKITDIYTILLNSLNLKRNGVCL